MEEQLSGEEEERRRNRQKRLEEMRISKQKQMMRRMYMKKAAPFVLGAFIIFIIKYIKCYITFTLYYIRHTID